MHVCANSSPRARGGGAAPEVVRKSARSGADRVCKQRDARIAQAFTETARSERNDMLLLLIKMMTMTMAMTEAFMQALGSAQLVSEL